MPHNPKPSQCKKYTNNTVSFLAAVGGTAELHNVLAVLLRCGLGVQALDDDACLIATIILGALFQIPSELFFFKNHSVFEAHPHHHDEDEDSEMNGGPINGLAPDAQSQDTDLEMPLSSGAHYGSSYFTIVTSLPQSNPVIPKKSNKKCKLQYGEFVIDFLAALTDAGLCYASLVELCNRFYAPPYLKYILGGVLCPPRALGRLGINNAHQFSALFTKKEAKIIARDTNQMATAQITAWSCCSIGISGLLTCFAGVVAGLSHGLETFYESTATVRNFGGEKNDCQSRLLDFNALGNALAYMAIGLLTAAMVGKVATVEGIHVKKAYEKHGGLVNWMKATFTGILTSIGNFVASLLHTLPAAAIIAILPLDAILKPFFITALVLLDSVVGTVIHGKYWQDAVASLKETLLEWCCGASEQPLHRNALPATVAL